MLLSRCTRVSKAFCAAAYCSVQAVAVSVVSSRLSKCPPWHRMVSVERVDISTVDQTGPLVGRCCPVGTQPDEVTLVVQLHSLRSVSAGACVSCPSMAPGLTHEASRCGVRDATAHVPCTLRRRSGFMCSSQRSAEHGVLAPTQMRFASCSAGTAGTRRALHCLFWLKFAPWEWPNRTEYSEYFRPGGVLRGARSQVNPHRSRPVVQCARRGILSAAR